MGVFLETNSTIKSLEIAAVILNRIIWMLFAISLLKTDLHPRLFKVVFGV